MEECTNWTVTSLFSYLLSREDAHHLDNFTLNCNNILRWWPNQFGSLVNWGTWSCMKWIKCFYTSFMYCLYMNSHMYVYIYLPICVLMRVCMCMYVCVHVHEWSNLDVDSNYEALKYISNLSFSIKPKTIEKPKSHFLTNINKGVSI